MKKILLIILLSLFITPTAFSTDKVIIFWYGMGLGHKIPSDRIAEYIKREYKNKGKKVEVELIDIKDYGLSDRTAEEQGKHRYLDWAQKEADSYTKYFNSLLGKHPDEIKSHFNIYRLSKLVLKKKPNVIISAFWGGAHVFYTLKKMFPKQLFNLKVGLLYTDYKVRNFIQMARGDRVNKIFLGSKKMVNDVLKVDPSLYLYRDSFDYSGIPINIPIINNLKKMSIRERKKSLGLDPDEVIIALARGGEAFVPISSLITSIITKLDKHPNRPKKYKVIALVGSSKADKAQLDRLKLKYGNKLKVMGRIPNKQYLTYISIVDVFVTKPGGVGLTEAAIINVPLVIMKGLGGQEEDNMKEFVGSGLAFKGHTEKELTDKTISIVTEKSVSLNILKNQREYFKTYAPEKIAQWVYKVTRNQKPINWNGFSWNLYNPNNSKSITNKMAINPILLKNWYFFLSKLSDGDLSSHGKIKIQAANYLKKIKAQSMVLLDQKIKKYEDLIVLFDSGKDKKNRIKEIYEWKLLINYFLKKKLSMLFKVTIKNNSLRINQLISNLNEVFTKAGDFGIEKKKILDDRSWDFNSKSFNKSVAEYLMLDGNPKKAQVYIQKISDIEYANETVIQLQGDIFVNRGLSYISKAAKYYEKALKKYPFMNGVRVSLIGIYSDLKKNDLAKKHTEYLLKYGKHLSENEYIKLARFYKSTTSPQETADKLLEFISKRKESLYLISIFFKHYKSNPEIRSNSVYKDKFKALIKNYKQIFSKEMNRFKNIPTYLDRGI